jgi:hypothetical protein
MDAVFAFLTNPNVKEISATAILVFVVIAILRGWLIPGRTHTRELEAEKTNTADWKEAHRRSEEAREALQGQNSTLLAGVRIADHFYKDFLPPVPNEDTQPRVAGGSNAVV